MLKIEDAISIEKKRYKGRSDIIYTYVFRCSGYKCKEFCRVERGHLKKSTGKCRRCCQKGEPFRAKYNELLKSADRHKRTFTLTFSEFLKFTEINKCYYCNCLIQWEPFTKKLESNTIASRAYQLDRKNSNLGYTKENCVVCCWSCNRMKSNLSDKEFIDICSKITHNKNNDLKPK